MRGRTGRVAGRALSAPGQLSGRRLACAGSVAGLAMPASCLRQGRKGHSKAPGADVRHRLDQARRKPPLQGANRQRRHSAAGRALRAPGQLSGRQLACAGGAVCCKKKAGKDTAKPPPRTRFFLSIKRERQLAAPRRELPRAGTHRARALTAQSGASGSLPPQGADCSAGAPAGLTACPTRCIMGTILTTRRFAPCCAASLTPIPMPLSTRRT